MRIEWQLIEVEVAQWWLNRAVQDAIADTVSAAIEPMGIELHGHIPI